jgi:hypothetical protein
VRARYLLLGAAVLVLGALNAWQWSPGDAARKRAPAAAAGAPRPEDFQVRAGIAAAERAQSARNLFQPRLPPQPPAPVPVKQVEAPPPPPGPPPKTPEQIAEEAARDELRQIRLVGVVFRGGQGQAFLVKGSEIYMVNAGGKVGERFRVEAIAADSIQLSDPASRVHGEIPVSGK